jgi:CRISPR-associated endoribonuclease Cas6
MVATTHSSGVLISPRGDGNFKSCQNSKSSIPVAMARISRKQKAPITPKLVWDNDTELVGIKLELQPPEDLTVPMHFTTELHSWFLDQVRRIDIDLSTYLHDGQTEKPFTISSLSGEIQSQGRSLHLSTSDRYQWTITLLSPPVLQWAQQWLQVPPTEMNLRSGALKIVDWQFAHPPTTYTQLLQSPNPDPTIALSFRTPTSFRRKGNHVPLPIPFNLFHSYLRRWNDFSGHAVDQDSFLNWVDEGVVILRHRLESAKVTAGKSGSVTGFTGAIELGLSSKAKHHLDFVQLWQALGRFAPYCGTGHKTTFGLGQTSSGWLDEPKAPLSSTRQALITQRIQELTEQFIAARKRTGGDRATTIAQTWATILARRELGESLQAIAQDLKMPYETVKTYAKLARQAAQKQVIVTE